VVLSGPHDCKYWEGPRMPFPIPLGSRFGAGIGGIMVAESGDPEGGELAFTRTTRRKAGRLLTLRGMRTLGKTMASVECGSASTHVER
jgi:hypothetical protein